MGPVNRADLFLAVGMVDDARTALEDAIRARPDDGGLHAGFGRLLASGGSLDAGKSSLREALEREPANSDALIHLALLERNTGRLDEALALLRRTVEVAPANAVAQFVLGEALQDLHRYEESLEHYDEAMRLSPRWHRPLVEASLALRRLGRIGEASFAAAAAVNLAPGEVEAWFALADGQLAGGDVAHALATLESLVEESDPPREVVDTALLAVQFVPGSGADGIARAHRDFERHLGEVERMVHARPGAGEAGRRLRVGYVSADFRSHSVAYFVEPVFARHDRAQVEVTGYFCNRFGDAMTQRLRGLCDRWVECGSLSDEQMVERVREDGIDVLVDLSGHTAGNRLGVFARKAAPVQATWLGYPTSTGLEAMDWRITDWEVDPAGSEGWSVESLVRLSGSYYCYRAPEQAPEVASLPALGGGGVSFGSFNNLAKLSDEVLELWGRILGRVKGSRLVLKSRTLGDEAVRKRMLERLAAVGVEAGRVVLNGWAGGTREHLGQYAQVDIGLDSWPYNGATTTCEALWMGVPVVTLRGRTHASRMGSSLLKAAGLGEWVAESAEGYVELAVGWAGRLEELGGLRAGMRQRLRGSGLLDEEGFTRGLEAAYRGMWRRWCGEPQEQAEPGLGERREQGRGGGDGR
jgi:predicted O-linked N-acetylglucosamine transferase (SPINDLY family)